MAVATYNQAHDAGSSVDGPATCRVVESLNSPLQMGAIIGASAIAVEPFDDCDACPHCADVCSKIRCCSCKDKARRMKLRTSCGCEQDYTMCEIRRHCTSESAWLVAGGYVYDATTYIRMHPGGENSILKKCGGIVDCMQDLHFHSSKGQKLWRKYRIGRVKKCCPDDDKIWWMFWK